MRRQIEDWGEMTWLVEHASHPGAALSLARMTLRPGGAGPAHRHENADEAIHVVSGEALIRIAQEWRRLGAGETAYVRRGTVHEIRSANDKATELMIAYSAGSRAYEEAANDAP